MTGCQHSGPPCADRARLPGEQGQTLEGEVCGVGPCSRAPMAILQEECGCPAPGGRRDLICSFQRALTPPATEDQSTFTGGGGCGEPTRRTWFSLVFWGVSAASRLPRSFTPHCWLWTPPSAAKRVSSSFFSFLKGAHTSKHSFPRPPQVTPGPTPSHACPALPWTVAPPSSSGLGGHGAAWPSPSVPLGVSGLFCLEAPGAF